MGIINGENKPEEIFHTTDFVKNGEMIVKNDFGKFC